MPTRERPVLVLLCGGRSTRMGQDKASMDFGGEALLTRMHRRLRAASSRTILAPGFEARPLPPLDDASLEIALDLEKDEGPLAGIRASFERLREDPAPAFLCSCDQPFLHARVIEVLRSALGPHEAAIPIADERRQVLSALYTREARDRALSVFASGERRVQAFARELDATFVEEAQFAPLRAPFFNVNDKASYTVALAMLDEESKDE